MNVMKIHEPDMFLDRWIRGPKFPKIKTNLMAVRDLVSWRIEQKGSKHRRKTWNKDSVRYDKSSKRWYLKLSALDVKEIRAKVWQRSLEKD